MALFFGMTFVLNKSNISCFFVFLIALATGCQKAPCDGASVILVVVDTLRADHCTPYGYRAGNTPRLARFANEGVLFEQAMAQASFTQASMGTLMTSSYPHHHGAGRHPSVLEERNLTLAEKLKSDGYHTAAMVTNPLLDQGSGFEQGFNEYVHFQEKDTQGAEGLVKRAIAWLENQGTEPFFLYLHFLDPHFPYVARPGFILERDKAGKQEYEALLKRRAAGKIETGELFFQADLTEAALEDAIRAYDSEVAFTDHHFGLLMDALERLGLNDRVLVIFTSDHGESLGEHDLHFCHGFSVYEEALHVPWVMRLPGKIPAAKRVRAPVRLLDLMPTLLRLLGMDRPEPVRGKDLSGWIFSREEEDPQLSVFSESEPLYKGSTGRRYPQRDGVYLEGDEGKWKSLRQGSHKLILIPGAGKRESRLYDLATNPGEDRDLSDSRIDLKRRLSRRMQEWLDDPERRESVTIPDLDEEWARRLQSLGYTR